MPTDTSTCDHTIVNYTHKHNGNVVKVALSGETRSDQFGSYHLAKFVGRSWNYGFWAEDAQLDLT